MGRSNYIKKGLLSTPPLNPELQEIYKFKKKKGIILSNPLAQKKIESLSPLDKKIKVYQLILNPYYQKKYIKETIHSHHYIVIKRN